MKKPVLYLVTAGILGVFMALGMACTTTPPPPGWDDGYGGEETPLLGGTVWEFSWEMTADKAKLDNYSRYGAPIRGSYKIEFQPGGIFVYPDYLNQESSLGPQKKTWERAGNNVRMLVTTSRYFHRARYEGIYDQANRRITGSYVESGWAGGAGNNAGWFERGQGTFTMTPVR